jgi:hypothetical protein
LRLRIGMTDHQVKEIIGLPLYKDIVHQPWGTSELWRYSESPSGGNYWRRWIEFRDGKVCWIESQFWWD